MKVITITFLILLLLSSPAFSDKSIEASEPALEDSRHPSLISSVRISSPVNFCGEDVPLDNQLIRERLEKELIVSLWERHQVVLWIKRSGRYMPYLEKMLKQNNMPDDLKYVPVIESALRPHARSRKGAVGFWQFMKPAGREYGLVINSSIDERRNIFASTEAAIKYFKDRYVALGSWTQAAAAYNMGEAGLKSEVLVQRVNDFYKLSLPSETQRYVFRIIAAKLILTDPEKYGFRFTETDLYPPLRFDRIELKCTHRVPVQALAAAAKTYYKNIKDLNPELIGHYLPRGSYSLLVPEGSAEDFNSRYKIIINQWLAENSERIYVVKRGDNLSTIAEKFNVPLPVLLIWNNLNPREHIHPGDRVVIYPYNENIN